MADTFVIVKYIKHGAPVLVEENENRIVGYDNETEYYVTTKEDFEDQDIDGEVIKSVQVIAELTKDELINIYSQIESQL